MVSQSALIVDDSKLARVKLSKMLAQYDIDVDTVSSAEDALSYLSYKQPAVIFMDHSMKGMDGLEAVKIIKTNPDTATIPIIMYTAQSGDVYVSQARALGALNVLSKDVIKPSNLEKVLAGVKIFPRDNNALSSGISSSHTESGSNAPEQQAPSINALHEQIAKTLEINVIRIRQEIGDSNRLLVKRLLREIQELKARLSQPQPPKKPPVKKVEADVVSAALPLEPPRRRRWLWGFCLAVIAILMLIVFQLHAYNEQQSTLAEGYATLSGVSKKQHQTLTKVLRRTTMARASNSAQTHAERINVSPLYHAISWLMNRNNHFKFGKPALDNNKLKTISGLVHYLDAAQFSGTVLIGIYSGDFCVTYNQSGQLVLPDADSPTKDCERLNYYKQDFSLQTQSSSFKQFLAHSAILKKGAIKVKIKSYGVSEPASPYPSFFTIDTAGEWNKIAHENNRIKISIIPASS